MNDKVTGGSTVGLSALLDDDGQKGALLFALWNDGHTWKLYESGICEGFPEGTLMVNIAAPKLDALRSIATLAGVAITNDTLAEIFR